MKDSFISIEFVETESVQYTLTLDLKNKYILQNILFRHVKQKFTDLLMRELLKQKHYRSLHIRQYLLD